jgi:hypothetical protein
MLIDYFYYIKEGNMGWMREYGRIDGREISVEEWG